ncbi:MAG: hypothetical protein R6W83_07605 [Cryobacterium sp.]
MSGAHRDPLVVTDGYRRPAVPVALFTPVSFAAGASATPEPMTPQGQLAWEATETAPLDWTPFVYTEAQERTIRVRRRLSLSSVVLGALGLVGAVIGVFGLPFSLTAVVLAVAARLTERRAGALWSVGLATGLVGLLIGIGWLVLIARVIVPLL